jgi:hypothetical protein
MRFEPRSFYLGEKVSYAASSVTLLLCLVALFFWYRSGARLNQAEQLSDMEPAAAKTKTGPEKSGNKKK